MRSQPSRLWLVAFVSVGVFVTFWMFDGPALLLKLWSEHRRGIRVSRDRHHPGDTLSLFAIVLLPRQFHVPSSEQ